MRRLLCLGALALALAAPAARAQSAFMPYFGYNFEFEDPQIGVAGRLGSLNVGSLNLIFQPDVEVGIGDLDYVQADGNLVAELSGTQTVSPYVGGGIGIIFANDDSDIGANAIGGVVFNTTGYIRPFAQARFSTAADDALSVQGGLIFGF